MANRSRARIIIPNAMMGVWGDSIHTILKTHNFEEEDVGPHHVEWVHPEAVGGGEHIADDIGSLFFKSKREDQRENVGLFCFFFEWEAGIDYPAGIRYYWGFNHYCMPNEDHIYVRVHEDGTPIKGDIEIAKHFVRARDNFASLIQNGVPAVARKDLDDETREVWWKRLDQVKLWITELQGFVGNSNCAPDACEMRDVDRTIENIKTTVDEYAKVIRPSFTN